MSDPEVDPVADDTDDPDFDRAATDVDWGQPS